MVQSDNDIQSWGLWGGGPASGLELAWAARRVMMGEKNLPPKSDTGELVSPNENQFSVRLKLADEWINKILLMTDYDWLMCRMISLLGNESVQHLLRRTVDLEVIDFLGQI